MSNIIDGIVKGLSGFMPQDDPDVKIFNAQSELKELAGKEEKVYARLGRQVYETDGGKSYPEIKTELDQLAANRQAARGTPESCTRRKDSPRTCQGGRTCPSRSRRSRPQLPELRSLQPRRNQLLPGLRYTPRSTGTSSCRQTLLFQLRSRSSSGTPFL